MKKMLLYITLVLPFFSCEKVLDLDAETKKPKLVVNSLFSNQNSWEVEVSKSLSVLDNGNLSKVDDAIVSIYDGTNLVSNLIYDGEKYIVLGLSAPPTVGKEYKVEVSAPNFTSVSATDVCPQPVAIISVDTSSVNSSIQGPEALVTIKFQDPVGQANYYGIELNTARFLRTFNSTTMTYDTVMLDQYDQYLSSSNPIVDNSSSDNYDLTLTFKDNLFDGQMQSITFSYNEPFYGGNNPNEFDVRTIRLISYTENTYKFTKSISTYRSADGNPFAEPVQVYSNIEGGFGIFGGQSSFIYRY